MTISGNYPQPVQVNGFTCRNCTEVDLAKKHIDPAHPKSGPYGIDAAHDPTRGPAVRLGGGLAAAAKDGDRSAQDRPYAPGQHLDVSA
jgi:hypothetical protein